MAKTLRLVVTTQNALLPFITVQSGNYSKFKFAAQLFPILRGIFGGSQRNGSVEASVDAVSATGTLTLSGQPTAADTVTVNGQAFTARASGAVANEFNIGASKEATAANCAAAVNASVTAGVPGVFTASVAGAVVTFTAAVPGRIGNAITLAKSMTNGAVSGTKLAGGADANLVTHTFGSISAA